MQKKYCALNIKCFYSRFCSIVFTVACLTLSHVSSAQNTKAAGRQNQVCDVTNKEIKALNIQVKQNIAKLRKEGRLNFKNHLATGSNEKVLANTTANVLFRWPLATASYNDFSYWHIQNFVDLQPVSIFNYDNNGDGYDDNVTDPGEIDDYNCGKRTYDGHGGIDICVDPYRWEIKNSGFVRVIAAADGIIVFKHQGEFDENCGNLDGYVGTTGRGNNLVILHADGTTASFYMHMKDSSLTSKEEGDYIYAGDYIGTVASAGRSSEPHLHFQVNTGYIDSANGNDETGSRIDPFVGTTCTEATATSWLNQLPYNDPAVLTLETHASVPGQYDDVCDKTIALDYNNSFSGNQTIWFRSKLRDWIDGSNLTFRVLKPDGNEWIKIVRSNSTGNRSYMPIDQSATVSAFYNPGTYRYTVTFGGKVYSHYFAIGCQASNTLSGAASGHKGNMVSDSITSTQTIKGADTNYIKYMADGHVTLKPGFRAYAGCRFVANTEGCSNSTANKTAGIASTEQKDNLVAKQNDITAKETAKVYPNPSKGMFTVQYTSKGNFNAMIMVRDLNGKVIYTSKNKTYSNQLTEAVNLGSIAHGIYLAEIHTSTKIISTKVLIQ